VIDPNVTHVDIAGGSGPDEISGLRVTFLQLGAGAFGRTKTVAFSEATAANVVFFRNNERVSGKSVAVSEAVALIERARRDETASREREAAAPNESEGPATGALPGINNLHCLVCGGRNFESKIVRQDSSNAVSTYKMDLRICSRCGFVMHFFRSGGVFG
jgi:hypothetical protein